MEMALLALGLVLVVEGLAYALAPSSIEAMLELLQRMPIEQRRMIGLGATRTRRGAALDCPGAGSLTN